MGGCCPGEGTPKMEGRNGMGWVLIVLEHNPAGNLVCVTSLATSSYPRCFLLRFPCPTDEAFMKLEARTDWTSYHRGISCCTSADGGGHLCAHP